MSMKLSKAKPMARLFLATALMAGVSSGVQAQNQADMDLLFKEGIFQREQGNVFTSIEALETVLSNQPSLHRARLELAVAYFRALNYEQAAQQAQKVLDDPKTPDNVRIAVNTFLAQIKRDQAALLATRNTWEPSVSLGFIYDSNINVGPDSSTLPGGFILDTSSLPRSSEGFVAQAGITHTFNSPNIMRFGETASRFIWQSRANIYNKAYLGESPYNLTVLSLSTGPGWIAPNKWRANINAQFDYLYLGDKDLALFSSISPSFTWQMKNGELTADAIYLNKDFKRQADAGRNSDYGAIGLTYGHLFNQGKFALQGGIHYFDESADQARFSNDGIEYFLGANVVAWNNGTVYGRVSRKDSQFEGADFAPPFVARDEYEDRYEVGFKHNFKEGGLKSWNLSGSYQYTRNRSNVSIYSYERDVFAVTLGRTF